MSDTEQLFIFAGVWTIGAAVVAYFIPKWPAKIIAFALLVGIPFWELPYGFYNFNRLCRLEGKPMVFEPIAPQKSICADYPFDASARTLTRFGFDNIEARSKSGEIIRYTRNSSDPLAKDSAHKLASEYCVSFRNNNYLPWRVVRHDFTIHRASNGSIVARHSVFDWLGMWWQEAMSPILGRGGECREDPVSPVMAALLTGSK